MSPALGDDPLKQSLFKKTGPQEPRPEMETAVARFAPSGTYPVPPAEAVLEVLGFRLGDRIFGAPISQIETVVRMVYISPVPLAPGFIEGIINVRGKVVPVMSLGRLLGLQPARAILSRRIIVGSSRTEQMALIVDSVSGLAAIPSERVSSPSPSMPMANLCSSVAKLEEPEGELMMILDFRKLLSFEQQALLEKGIQLGDAEAQLGRTWAQEDVSSKEVEESAATKVLRKRSEQLSLPVVREQKETRHILTFALGKEVYGLDLTSVCKILRAGELTQLPCAPKYVSGVVNFEGQITPVVDLKGILGISEPLKAAHGRILVVEDDGSLVAFVADEVFDVLELDVAKIEAPLSTIEKVRADFIEGEVRVAEKLVIILNWRNIMLSEEMGKTAELGTWP